MKSTKSSLKARAKTANSRDRPQPRRLVDASKAIKKNVTCYQVTFFMYEFRQDLIHHCGAALYNLDFVPTPDSDADLSAV